MATPLAAGVGAPRTPSSGSGKSRRDTQPAGNDRLTDVLLLVSLVACLYAPARSYFAGGAVAPSLLRRDLSGLTIVVTGANTGIGYETARQLAAQNATVVLACRSMDRCRNAVAAITAAHPYVPATRAVAMPLDLADLASVKTFAAEVTSRFPSIDILVNNAGVAYTPKGVTAQGFETQLGTNHIGHFYLTQLLLPALRRGVQARGEARIINVASAAAYATTLDVTDLPMDKVAFNPINFVGYARSKLANILHARWLARTYGGEGIVAVSLHPGNIVTEIVRHQQLLERAPNSVLAPIAHVVAKTVWEGTQTTLHAALAEDVRDHNGEYYADCAPAFTLPHMADDANADELAKVTLRELAAAGFAVSVE